MNFEGLKDQTKGLVKSCSQKASGFLTEIQSPQDISSDTDKICWEDMWSDEEYREAMSVKFH